MLHFKVIYFIGQMTFSSMFQYLSHNYFQKCNILFCIQSKCVMPVYCNQCKGSLQGTPLLSILTKCLIKSTVKGQMNWTVLSFSIQLYKGIDYLRLAIDGFDSLNSGLSIFNGSLPLWHCSVQHWVVQQQLCPSVVAFYWMPLLIKNRVSNGPL